MSQHRRVFDYIELGAPDIAAAKRFYAEAFGWAFTDYGPGYAGIQDPAGGGEVGGLDAGTTPTAGGPLVLLYAEDLDSTVAAVVAAGGTITNGTYAFPGGRRAHFRDVAGNELGVWSVA
ncbi:putative enzyme related to lactoylglutathione lyase [Leucobacter exalbidus]|uniref:Enzyme related to lactoylglutathione lyase n=1 Tax=Leucobacter exalbidus TaxID=662960 RepID=A0A940PW03_9MICO|nr:VOC family protein [Leucobacter exalbidus]MBP1326319.1 putative enzyme related to lactoylglutathione lyase [Leucobacter exalbidus]